MESIDSLSGLESLRRPPGTGWPPRLPLARDLGLGDGHRGALFRDELRRAGGSDPVSERTAGADEHSARIARRRAARAEQAQRAERERPTGPREKEGTRRPAERRIEREETREDVAPEGARPTREAPPVPRGGREPGARGAVEAAPEAAPERSLGTAAGPTLGAPTPAAGPAARPGGPAPAGPQAPAGRPAGRPEGAPAAPAADRGPARAARPAPPAPPEPADVRRAAEVLDQLRAAIRPGLRQAVVRLDPAELGAVTIRVAVQRGGVQGRIEVESRETLELLERHAPELRAALESVGLELAELELTLTGDERRPAPGTPDAPPTAARRRAAAADDEPDFRPAARRLRLAADAVDVDA